MKSAHEISAHSRIVEPGSRFRADFLRYKSGESTYAEFIEKLPHVAMVGDSLSRNVHVASRLRTFWQARRAHGNDWFLNTGVTPDGINSVFQRLEQISPLVATEYGGLGALVDGANDRQNLFRKILRTRNFSGQVSQLLLSRPFPHLILIWIGHNNVDWAWRCPPDELTNPEERLLRLSKQFRENFTRQMQRLLTRAKAEANRSAIIVYALADFESFFKARAVAESLHENSPELYPYLGSDHKFFISMRPAYRQNLLRLVQMVNTELCAMVKELQRETTGWTNVEVRFSDALARVDLSRVEVIHAVDGWHPSVYGHNLFAEAAFSALGPALDFLGINN
jgi:lysophospholipase L1-like esterase